MGLTEIRTPTPEELAEWEAEFEAAARRSVADRIKYGFIKTYKPVMDDVSFRAFDTMEDYRRWCETELPWWLGYSERKADSGADPGRSEEK
jgi:hypothetical protein